MKLRLLALILPLIIGAATLHAILPVFTWTGNSTSTGLVTESPNWDSGVPTGTGGENAVFGSITGSQSSIQIPASLTLNDLTFNTGRPSYSINGSGSPTLTLTGTVTVNSGAEVVFNNSLALALSSGEHTVNIASATTLRVFSSVGEVSGVGSVKKTGDGTLVFSAPNSYTGGTVIDGGKLTLLNTTGSGTGTGTVTVNSGANLTIGGGASGGSLSGNIINNATVEFAHSSDSYTYGGIISGTGVLNKIGAGSLTLTGANTYGGGTSISNGSLTIGVTNALPTSTSVTMSSTAALNVNQNQTLAGLSGSNTNSIAIASGKSLTLNNTAGL